MIHSTSVIASVILFLCLSCKCENANECDVAEANSCYENLIAFEGADFPFYGKNEEELDTTCKKINSTFECLFDYTYNCEGRPECDDDCKNAINVAKKTDFVLLSESLCTKDSLSRSKYLEFSTCFQEAESLYQQCHNISLESKYFIQENAKQDTFHEMICCYTSWFQGCLEEATEFKCGKNASSYIESALDLLMKRSNSQCAGEPHCKDPPLPGSVYSKTDKPREEKESKPMTSGASKNFFTYNSFLFFKFLALLHSISFILSFGHG